MAGLELRTLLEESEASVSPLLCLSQSGPPSFLQPVTVQLPLPPGVTGFSLDRSHLHLLYRTPLTTTWDDITTQVALEFTHLYARFQVTHFSWSVSPSFRRTPSALPLYGHTSTLALPGTGSGIPPKPVWGAWPGRPGNGCDCTV